MLLGVDTDKIDIKNAPSSYVAATTLLKKSEQNVDPVLLPMLNPDLSAMMIQRSTSAVIRGDNIPTVSTVTKSKDGATTNNQDELVPGCSSITKNTATADCGIAERVYPKIGSPSVDLMVVNTNGFNPLQHAALRGNPG